MAEKELYERIYQVALLIPAGKVATYGQLAFCAGIPRGGRLAGRAMAHAPEGRDIPCHRVVNSAGRCAPGFFTQQCQLEKEGVPFKASGLVDMKRCLWNPGECTQKEPARAQNP